MSRPVSVAVPRKGRPLEAALERFAAVGGDDAAALADDVSSTLRYEKAITKGRDRDERGVYERLAAYSDPEGSGPEYTLIRDDREGNPRRVVFDSAVIAVDGHEVRLVGREEPFRALRTHEFALGFDSADLVLEEVVGLEPEGVSDLSDVNARIDPRDTDVRVATGLGDTVYHTLMATPETLPAGVDLDRSFVVDYEGPLCISPRYERLVEAVLGTDALAGVEFVYPEPGQEEEAAIADAGLGVYLTVTGGTARDHGLVLGEDLFPSETVLMENEAEATRATRSLEIALASDIDTALAPE
ncbi:hypothetical protein [Halobaculum magnesiiphilum]|uniref:Uncharacterized protein n=1 Tax=Halobaculum magnesiiphilum TaxID=1017351 RepID=A0A8T8WF83_9EURY|nr:hypothetical protein [Halobaculum magnesiiphilum]QZP38393.1 hypothetical protein K6T50_04430 [Halobaculum magnesiiphilum]